MYCYLVTIHVLVFHLIWHCEVASPLAYLQCRPEVMFAFQPHVIERCEAASPLVYPQYRPKERHAFYLLDLSQNSTYFPQSDHDDKLPAAATMIVPMAVYSEIAAETLMTYQI